MGQDLGELLWKKDGFEARRQDVPGVTAGFSICKFSDV